MAAGAIGGGRGNCNVLSYLICVAVGVAAEIGRMTFSTGAAYAAVYRGIATTVSAGDPGAIDV